MELSKSKKPAGWRQYTDDNDKQRHIGELCQTARSHCHGSFPGMWALISHSSGYAI